MTDSARLQRNAADAADQAIERAHAVWRLGDLAGATDQIGQALAILETAGLWSRLGNAYKLHAMVFIGRDQASLALAAATRALGYPDIGARDRMYLYATVAMCLHQLVDLPTGGKVMIEQAWPEALEAGDPKTLVDCASRCAGLMHDLTCWARGIPHLSLLGLDAQAPEPAAVYLQQGQRFIAMCEPHMSSLTLADRSWMLCQKGCIVALAEGFDVAWPVFLEAREYANGLPRQTVTTENTIGMSARICGRLDVALEHLQRARTMESAQAEQQKRHNAWELSRVMAALGRTGDAFNELQVFDVLQARKSKLSIEWITDAANQRRYGGRPDVRSAQETLTSTRPPAAVSRARLHIDAHLHERLGLDEVASAAHVSKRTLQNLFREHLGVSVGRFIRERRLQRADEELRSGARRVGDVAERAGYSNSANFSRDYKQRFGRSPSSTHRLVHGFSRSPNSRDGEG